VSGAIVNPVEDSDAGGDNKWLAAAMMILPSRSDSWACHGLLGPLECFRFSCSVGKKLGLVALPPQVSFPCAGPIHLFFSDQQRRPRAGFAGLATWILRPRCKALTPPRKSRISEAICKTSSEHHPYQ
jgi:hypothetical protein